MFHVSCFVKFLLFFAFFVDLADILEMLRISKFYQNAVSQASKTTFAANKGKFITPTINPHRTHSAPYSNPETFKPADLDAISEIPKQEYHLVKIDNLIDVQNFLIQSKIQNVKFHQNFASLEVENLDQELKIASTEILMNGGLKLLVFLLNNCEMTPRRAKFLLDNWFLNLNSKEILALEDQSENLPVDNSQKPKLGRNLEKIVTHLVSLCINEEDIFTHATAIDLLRFLNCHASDNSLALENYLLKYSMKFINDWSLDDINKMFEILENYDKNLILLKFRVGENFLHLFYCPVNFQKLRPASNLQTIIPDTFALTFILKIPAIFIRIDVIIPHFFIIPNSISNKTNNFTH